ncbi:PAS domain-containing sensor histidine kinase [Ferrovum sp. PN-J185]|uniref:nitrogen regulation protein NR(II) n=1 Tax=Ferrovum sp. PN-J185 TaxID=1356306 RepID=UPI00079865CF|nr:nitrogen regulation protein NR(II) [Ferrovum sp. PN-J185]KXW55985.1 nitrogen regulation protein NR(II) [Ferrovum sp. PN-J185]MCC6068303.1 PAS domain-containing sensor histidine kinase [Ferrovum sp. PN-J185]
MKNDDYRGLDLITTAVVVLNKEFNIVFINTAAEDLFAVSRKNILGYRLDSVLADIERLLEDCSLSFEKKMGFIEHEWTFHSTAHDKYVLTCTGTPLEDSVNILLEFRPINQRAKIEKEEKIIQDQEVNRQLIRNLAHEIRNPLGGIKGAAQLLEKELDQVELREYTEVIKNEAGRLQLLLDRMLSPNSRLHQTAPLNIHEVLERVRSVTLAEFPKRVSIQRDYDTSIPEFLADREQLIQAILNIVRNAAQAFQTQGTIKIQTRILRQITLAKKRFKLGIVVKIIDNGPGIPTSLQPRIFQPLVSGREGGTGLGLMLAQNLISQHYGMVEFESRPGFTCFDLILPITETEYS